MFEIIPAIDLLNGQCVRLKQGRYNAETVYSDNPLAMAKQWEAQGGKRLHIVDLDGARTGLPKNVAIIKAIAQGISIPIQVGGGIRNFDLIKELIDCGVNRIILGTTAVKNPNLLGEICKRFGEQIAVAIDTKKGLVATEGWTQVSKKDTLTLAKEAIELGVKRFIYTDITRDGMLEGPNLESIKEFISGVSVPVIASGGVSSKKDIEDLKTTGAEGCVVGKALYEGKIKLEEIV